MTFGQIDPAALFLTILAFFYTVGSTLLRLWTINGKRQLASKKVIGRWSQKRKFQLQVFEWGSSFFPVEIEIDTTLAISLPSWRSCEKSQFLKIASLQNRTYTADIPKDESFGLREKGGFREVDDEVCWIPFDDLFGPQSIHNMSQTTIWANRLSLHVEEQKLQIRSSADISCVNVVMDERALATMLLCFGTLIVRTDSGKLQENGRILANSPRLYSTTKRFGRIVYYVDFRGPIPFSGTSEKEDRVTSWQIKFILKLIAEVESLNSLVKMVLERCYMADRHTLRFSETFTLDVTMGNEKIPTYFKEREKYPKEGHLYILGWLHIAQTALQHGSASFPYIQYIPMDQDVVAYMRHLLERMSFRETQGPSFPYTEFSHLQFSDILHLLEQRKRTLCDDETTLLRRFENWLAFIAKQEFVLGKHLQAITELSRDTIVELGR